MEELLSVLVDIRNSIDNLNSNIIELKDSVKELRGDGLYNSITDVCDKLDTLNSIDSHLFSIDMNTNNL
ncbi:hypothetical protein BEP19_12935 [Ammoniphilus oxalaticus]|uniref:Uncharacterized protein n=1 Tax=Ammoniphilus oxalaticus TaxID=66863 RepID=A0A419SH57_9BACL|nr:hypothetical protein BEP19_12935 [Ammoniphilus oxalaticus]